MIMALPGLFSYPFLVFLAEAPPNINNMPEFIAALIKLYADDAKIYSSVSLTSQNNNQVQTSLAESVQWEKDWFMFYNFTKCHHLQVGKCNTDTRYSMKSGNGTYVLKKVKYEKDLGVIIYFICCLETILYQKLI